MALRNPTRNLAFFIRIKLEAGRGGDEVLPVLWQDNYISLLPGESREISAHYRAARLNGLQPFVEVSGWNVEQSKPAAR